MELSESNVRLVHIIKPIGRASWSIGLKAFETLSELILRYSEVVICLLLQHVVDAERQNRLLFYCLTH